MIDESEESFLERICGIPNLTYKDIRGMGVIEDSYDVLGHPEYKELQRECYFFIRFYEEKNNELEEKFDEDGEILAQDGWITKNIKQSCVYNDFEECKKDYKIIAEEIKRDYAKDISLIGFGDKNDR